MEKCKWCESAAARKQGRIWLCEKHYRFQQMRTKSRSCRKSVPTYEELQCMHDQLDSMACPSCERKMNWLGIDGPSTVITIQHDRAGGHRLICRSCNVKHMGMPGDSFFNLPNNHRWCPKCKNTMETGKFCLDSNRTSKTKTYCRSCSSKMHADWVRKTRETYNENRRRYYHKRKSSGNPIPR